MTRFIHTADWQIGKPYRQIADVEKRFKLQQERLNAIGRIRDAARMQAADFVVVAGDLFADAGGVGVVIVSAGATVAVA